MGPNAAFLVPLIAAGVGALVAYITASRKMSGKIGTSEATDLWAESSSIRDDYRLQINASSVRTTALEDRVAKLETLNDTLRRENEGLHIEKREYEAVITELRSRLDTSERMITKLTKQVEQLRLELTAERQQVDGLASELHPDRGTPNE